MKFIKTKTGIAIIGLIGVFVFGYLIIGGVMGNTQIGLTLFSNPELDNGLISHWTLDSNDLDLDNYGNEVQDRIGSNHGNYEPIAPTPSSSGDTGALSPGTTVSSADGAASCGTTGNHDWNVPNNAQNSNGSYADLDHATYDDTDISQRFEATNFGFTIPDGETITGVTVEIERFSAINVADYAFHLVVGGSVDTTENKADLGTQWGTTDPNSYVTYGGSSDTWSIALTEANVEASDFGMTLCVQAGADNSEADIDHVRMTVHHQTPANPGSATSTKPGRIGQSLSLDGHDDYIDWGNVGGGIQTVSFWMKIATNTANMNILEIDGTDKIETSASGDITATSFPGATIYGNGVEDATTTTAGEWVHVTVTDSTGVTGSSFTTGSTTKYFGGLIDDVRIYDRELSQAEVQRLYELGATTHIGVTIKSNSELEDGLVLHYPFDTPLQLSNGNTFADGGSTTTDPSIGEDQANGIIIDSAGYIYVTGIADDEACGGSGTDNCHYTYKLDSTNGNMMWDTTIDPSSGDDAATSITTDPSGNVYVTGYCLGCGNGGAHYTYKLDSTNGNTLWSTTTDPTSNEDRAQGITSDSSGNIYVTGYCGSSGCGTNDAIYTYKIDASNGDMLWATTTDPTASSDRGHAITTDAAGDIYVTGYCAIGCDGSSSGSYYTFKIDPDTTDMMWATSTDPSSTNDLAYAITTDPSGNVYVTGQCTINCVPSNSTAHYTIKINSTTGAMIWATTTDPTTGPDGGRAITTDSEGYVYVSGTCLACGSAGSRAYYTFKIDPDTAAMIWATTTDPTSLFDEAFAMTTDSAGFVYVTGYCEGCGSQGSYGHHTIKIDPATGDMVELNFSTISDATGNLTNTKVFARGAVGVLGQAVTFDGVDDYVRIGSPAPLDSLTSFTVCSWVYPRQHESSDEAPVIIGNQSTTAGWKFQLLRNGIGPMQLQTSYRRSSDNGLVSIFSVEPIYLNTWMHVCAIQDGADSATMSLWVDGEKLENVTPSSSGARADDSANVFKIGERETPTFDSYKGRLDDLRVYNRALSAPEINRLYGLGATTHVGVTVDSNPDLDDGLVGHWTFDGGDMIDNVNDLSGTGNDGILQSFGGSTTTKPGKIGQSIDFDGVNDYIRIEDDSSLDITSEISVASWVRLDRNYGRQDLVGKWGTGNATRAYILLLHADGGGGVAEKAQFWISDGSSLYQTDPGNIAMATSTWYHLVGTYETDGDLTLYVNGEVDSTKDIGVISINTNNEFLGFGDNAEPDADPATGRMDDVRVYDRALTADEVLRLYQLGN